MQTIETLQNQIKALNRRIKEGKVKNLYAVQNKVKALKERLKIEIENHYWENFLSN